MKQTIFLKILSVVLALVLLVCSVPMPAIMAFAADTNNTATTGTAVEELKPSEVIQKEMSARSAITKDRSQIKDSSQAAVYNDGELIREGTFADMWKAARDLAEYVKTDAGHSNEGRSGNIEFVLNTDIKYDKIVLGESTMTISNQKLTIDLNGHLLHRNDGGGSVLMVTKNAILTIMDSNPHSIHRGHIGEKRYWVPMDGGGYIIGGGVISGGYHRTGDGGGLYIDDHSTVYMLGGTLAGNKADVGSAAYLEDHSTLDMSRGNATICYNYCDGTSSDGGAIFLRSDCTVIGGYVNHNVADNYGGGVRAKGNNILVKDVVIYANRAQYGGGLYIERDGTGQTVTVSGCKIIGNYASYSGGGAYIYDLHVTNMSDCWVENNSTDYEGGGIHVSDWTGSDLNVSGKMIVRNNFVSASGESMKSNLYLEGDDDLIAGALSIGSEIWLRTEIPAVKYNGISKSLVSEESSTSHLFFFADEEGYCVKYQDDPAKEHYRHLYLSEGTRTADDTKVLSDYATKLQATPYKVETGEYQDVAFPLYRGYFEYVLMSTTDFYSASPFYYSDGYFFEDPKVYNYHLASMSINLAVAAFGRYTTDVGDNAYANHFANVKQLLSDIGCADVNFFANEDYQIKPAYYGEDGRLSTIAVAISQKEIEANGESYTLVPVAIRGGNYEAEWGSNVTIGNSGESAGFSDAANQVYGHIQNYIENYGLSEKVASGKVKFWVVGYSRAGATANLTSKRLVDSYAEVGNQIFGYTFEAPMGGVESAIEYTPYTGNGTYPTIHNTINELDFVTLVAPAEMGFFRYGVDHLVGSTAGSAGISYATDSAYYQQRMKMIAQLNAINPYYKFDDSWGLADVNLVFSNIPLIGSDLIDTGVQFWDDPNPECENMYRYLRWFFERIQADGLNLPTKTIPDPKHKDKTITVIDYSKAREYFSTYKPLSSIEGNLNTPDNYGYSDLSVQEAAAQLMYLVMESLTEKQMSDLMDGVMTNALILKSQFGMFDLLSKKEEYIDNWDTYTELVKAQKINWLIPKLLNANGGVNIDTILEKEQMTIIKDALPVILWFVLNYVSIDFNEKEDDGLWGVGTFINNAANIISNHYSEITVAWVRSYDEYYLNDLQSYRLDTDQITNIAPTGVYVSASNSITLNAQAGSSIFYSIDGGETWNLYTKSVSFDDRPVKIEAFSIYRGVKSDVVEISMNGWAGSLLGNGNIWFFIFGSAIIVGFCVAGIEIGRNKKKEQETAVQ